METLLKTTIKFIFLIIVSLAISFAATFNVSTSRSQIGIGETFQLVITSKGKQTNLNTPELAPLQKNFTILDTARNQSLNSINGQLSQQEQWVITLIPKYTGKLLIPSLRIGRNKTPSTTIQVATSQTVKTNNQPAIFIRRILKPLNPYVQSEVLYQLRVYYTVPINNAFITPPSAKNATVKQLGLDKKFKANIKGKTYQVFQRNFVIFPKKAGKLHVSSALFRGQAAVSPRPSLYSGFYTLNTKPIQLIAPAITLKVKAAPINFAKQWWLPASDVTFSQVWSSTHGNLKVGQPITRTITIEATGLMASQLPKISVANSSKYNTYASQPSLENTMQKNHLVGIRSEKIVYIPTQRGTITFPAIKLSWWNTQTNQQEIAQLPKKAFHVLAGTLNKTIEASSTPNNPKHLSGHSVIGNQTTPKHKVTHKLRWFVGIGLLLLIVLLLFLIRSKRKSYSAGWKNTSANKAYLSLKQACLNHHPIEAKAQLLTWAQAKFNDTSFKTLTDIAKRFDNENLSKQIQVLQNALYSQDAKAWSGKALWQSIEALKKRKTNHKSHGSNSSLPQLNPYS